MNTLTTARVRRVLNRLRAEERRERPELVALGGELADRARRVPDRPRYDLPVAEMSELFAGLRIPVSAETGNLLHLLARFATAKTVVEFGTSFGVSAIYLASAVRDNGDGRVIGTELHPDKVRAARANLAEAGLDDLVEIREGDARTTLRDLPGEVDLVLVDGFPGTHLEVLRLVEPSLRQGALVVSDGVPGGGEILRDYHDYVHDPANGYSTIEIPLGDGLEVSVRLR
ncbi:class I SAM-dependent methyltransferase [Amycolatopsis sp. QT-25]|uniref:O-methyltransferase n=1 Tax=Amycolatopsis sp. QT-25 TaxID=3034022 RepID=UPI0023ECE482|nr:class I SAM-dependent methyltransferase [Amycolatopsis sp. QT-25]WET83069.1 class I SAM-dependent methyltransferase [Amycolatopsis sp. QT-25]